MYNQNSIDGFLERYTDSSTKAVEAVIAEAREGSADEAIASLTADFVNAFPDCDAHEISQDVELFVRKVRQQ